jgi:16S rRNA (adenine1518-N6/adenine1519-N6)-dimethyltransferase
MQAKKSLGQNFLSDPEALEDILHAANLSPADTVLEVGPGKGVLTEELLKRAGAVVAVEKDDRLIAYLSKKFAGAVSENHLRLIHGDILDLSPYDLALPKGYVVVANIPYYITGQFLRSYLENELQPDRMVLMLQKEVAERIALEKKESLLSIGVKAYGTPQYVRTVPRESFDPAPKVDSAVLAVEHISRDFFAGIDEKDFFNLVRRGFAQKRKLLAKNIGSSGDALEGCGIAAKARAEELSPEAWQRLFLHVQNIQKK